MKHLCYSTLLTTFLSTLSINSFSSDFFVEYGNGCVIFYNYINDGKELEVASHSSGQFNGVCVIPEEVTYMNRTRKVTSIGEEAFLNSKSLKSMTLPNSVDTIKKSAFSECHNLTSINLGNSVKYIGRGAFYGCKSLTTVTLPDCLTTIEGCAFMICESLTSITIPNSVTKIGDGAFQRCSNLTSISIPSSVTSIESSTFLDCEKLSSISIPNSVTSIGYQTFENCTDITSISIPNSVTSIGGRAFARINMHTVISLIENPFTIYDNTFSKNTYFNATLYVPKGTIEKYKGTEGWKAFAYIEEIADPSGINQTCTNAILIKSFGDYIMVEGVSDGEGVDVFTISGTKCGSTISHNGVALINTNLRPGSVAIVKIKDKSIKVTIK